MMFRSLALLNNNKKAYTLKRKFLCGIAFLIFAACFTSGCEKGSSPSFSIKLLGVSDEGLLDLNQTITVTLDEKDGSGITGTAVFSEYVLSDGDSTGSTKIRNLSDGDSTGSTKIRNLDVEIQNAVPGHKYTAYIYTGTSCDTPGNIWDVEGFKSLTFTADENGMGYRSYLVDITFNTNSDTDINGKVLVIHEQVGSGDLSEGTQVSCGIITSSQ